MSRLWIAVWCEQPSRARQCNSLSVAKFDRFEDLEDQVMDYLVSVTDLAVFGCAIDFLHLATDLSREPNLGQAAAEQGMLHNL